MDYVWAIDRKEGGLESMAERTRKGESLQLSVRRWERTEGC